MIEACTATCRGCPSETSVIVDRPVTDARIAIVFETPSQRAQAKNDFYSGRPGTAGHTIAECLKGAGIDPATIYTCSALNCRPNHKKEAMVKKAMLSCRPRLIEELKQANVEKVLCLGTIGFSALTSAERNLPITKTRGKWHQAFGMNVLPTFSPELFLAAPDWFRDFADDLEKFVSTDGPMPFPDIEIWVPESLKEMDEAIEFLEQQDIFSCDLETTGLSPVKDEIIAAGFGVIDRKDNSGVTVIFDDQLLVKKKPWRAMSRLLSSEKHEVVFHNAKFDLQFFKHSLLARGLEYSPARIQDTMLLHYTLDERPMGKFRSHVLERLSESRYDAPAYGIDMKKFLAEWEVADAYDRRRLRTGLHKYLGLDCYYTMRLLPDLWNEAMQESEALLDLYEEYLLPGSLALADVELNGILIDQNFYLKAQKKLEGEAEKILKRLRKATGKDEFNPGSPKQVQEFVYGTKEGQLGLPFGEKARNAYKHGRQSSTDPSQLKKRQEVFHTARRGGLKEGPTAKAVLKSLGREFPENKDVLDDIVQYRNLTKNVGTYVKGMLDRVDVDGRIRGNFNLHGTATGRLSSDNPNLQNIPDSSHTGIEVRNGFIAPVGSVLIEADYSQLELRVAAWLSDDDGFREVFIEDRDVHQEVTWALFQKTKEQASKYERYMAKCCNFGVMYGRGASSLAEGPEMDYIHDNGGERWSKEDVQEFFDRMLRNWPRYNEWMEEQRALVYEQQYVETPTGRRRRFPLIPPGDGGTAGRQAINTPIQGTASDFTLSALIRIHARLPEGAAIVSTVHDSILIECKRALVDQVLEIVHEEMELNLPFDTGLPFKADADVAESWGKMGKYTWEDQVLVPIALAEEVS